MRPILGELTLILLSVAALVLSIRLISRSRSDEALPGCGAGSGCDAVLATRWSRWGHLSVASLASVFFALCLGSALATSIASSAGAQRVAWGTLSILCLTGASASLWFISLQFFIVRRWCVYCLAVHVLSLSMAFTVLMTAPNSGLLSPIGWGAVALGLAVLVVGQLILQPARFAVRMTDRVATERSVDPSPAQDRTTNGLPKRSREVSLMRGRVRLQMADWPLLGPIDAPFVLAYLFDYTCPSCRHVHRLLDQAVERQQRLAVLLIPVPQHPDCNAFLQTPSQKAAQGRSCDYSRLGLMLWKNDPAKYASFDRWLRDAPLEPTFEMAEAFVRNLIGDVTWEAIDHDIDRLISQGVAAHQATGSRKIPMILFPKATVVGEIPTIIELMAILQKELGQAPAQA